MISKKIEIVIAQAKEFKKLPSEILFIEDEYVAYCFNEACFYLMMRLKNGDKPNYRKFEEQERLSKQGKTSYSNFKDFYKNYIGG